MRVRDCLAAPSPSTSPLSYVPHWHTDGNAADQENQPHQHREYSLFLTLHSCASLLIAALSIIAIKQWLSCPVAAQVVGKKRCQTFFVMDAPPCNMRGNDDVWQRVEWAGGC